MKRGFKTFLKEEDGMGVVEIILIIVVLVSLVAIFKKEITSVVKYSLQGTTQGRYLTGGVPPVRFSM